MGVNSISTLFSFLKNKFSVRRERREYLYVFVANLISKLLSLLLIVLLTKNFSVAEFGEFELLMSLLLLSVDFVDFGSTVTVVDYIGKKPFEANRVFNSLLIFKLFLISLLLTICLVASDEISILLFDVSDYSYLIKILPLGVFLNSILNLTLAYFQGLQNFGAFSSLQVAVSLLKLMVVWFLIAAYQKLLLVDVYFVLISAPILAFIWLLYNNKYKLKEFVINVEIISEVLKGGIWIYIASLFVLFTMRADLFMIKWLGSSVEDVGLFAFALKINGIFILIINSVATIILPKLNGYFEHRNVRDYRARLYSIKFLLIAALVVSGLLVKPTLSYFYDNGYDEASLSLQILIFSLFFSFYSSNLGLLLIYFNKTKLLPLMNSFQFLLVVGLNFLLIPKFGINGAAVSLLCMRVIGFLLVNKWTLALDSTQ